MVAPVYPNGYFNWTDRVDELNIDYAEDPNSLAAEVESIEDTLGLLPQVQKNPNLGPPISFVNVDQRLDYITAMSHIPVCQISAQSFQVSNWQGPGSHYGEYNVYQTSDYDPYGMFNGSDMTCLISGFYIIDVKQFWNWSPSGYHCHHFWIDNEWMESDMWRWDFPGNAFGGYWRGPDNDARPGHTHTTWMGLLNQGQRLSVISENGTSFSPCTAQNLTMKAALIRRSPAPTNVLPQIAIAEATSVPPTVTRFNAPGFLNCNIVGGLPNILWGTVLSPVWAGSYTVAVYFTGYPNTLAYYQVVPAPGVQGPNIPWVINGLPVGNSYEVHVWANGGVLDPAHAISSFSI
jgi:hypothetical protein